MKKIVHFTENGGINIRCTFVPSRHLMSSGNWEYVICKRCLKHRPRTQKSTIKGRGGVSQINVGDTVKIIASPVELFALGIMRTTAEAISGQDLEVSDVREYPPDRAQKMIYVGGLKRGLWVLDSFCKVVVQEQE